VTRRRPPRRSKAAIIWNRWDTVRNHRIAVFNYRVSQHRKFEADSSITFFSADSTVTYPRHP